MRIVSDMIYSKTIGFINICKMLSKEHFTRVRKMPLKSLLLTVLFRKGRTLQMELRAFKKLLALKESISKVGYLKQRTKLNPLAFLVLAKHHAQNFYTDSEIVRKKNGYLILAIDGSAMNIPTTDENIALYGNASSKNVKTQAQLGLSCLYDTINKMVIDSSINRFKFSEREQALFHIDNMREVIGEHLSVIIFDRGYPSGEFFIELIERQQKILVRLPSVTFKKEQKQMKHDDCIVEIIFDNSRLSVHKGTHTHDVLAKAEKISLRFVRVKLQSGEYEYLATNLTAEEFSTGEISELYSMRWGIETT